MPLQQFPQPPASKQRPCRDGEDDDDESSALPMWPYRTAPMETVDRVMDMQCALFELALVTNNYYRLQTLLMMLTGFMLIVFDSYGVIDMLYNTDKTSFQVTKTEGLLLLSYQLCINATNIVGLVMVCGGLRFAVRRIADLAHKVLIVSPSAEMRERMAQFSLQVQRAMPQFTAFGMFEIDATLIFTIVGATTTYLIILVQYSSKNPSVSQQNAITKAT